MISRTTNFSRVFQAIECFSYPCTLTANPNQPPTNHTIPKYNLSHPLNEVNLTNEVYIQRGFLGATMIVLYALITTISCVRFITAMRKNGGKTQLHLAGMSCTVYVV